MLAFLATAVCCRSEARRSKRCTTESESGRWPATRSGGATSMKYGDGDGTGRKPGDVYPGLEVRAGVEIRDVRFADEHAQTVHDHGGDGRTRRRFLRTSAAA